MFRQLKVYFLEDKVVISKYAKLIHKEGQHLVDGILKLILVFVVSVIGARHLQKLTLVFAVVNTILIPL
jgi:hypothetical protein